MNKGGKTPKMQKPSAKAIKESMQAQEKWKPGTVEYKVRKLKEEHSKPKPTKTQKIVKKATKVGKKILESNPMTGPAIKAAKHLKKSYETGTPIFRNGGYAQFSPGDETITKKEARRKDYNRRVVESINKDILDDNPMNQTDVRKIVKQIGKDKSSGYNELEQKKKAAKVDINKAKARIAKEKKEYKEYVDSGQREKDREASKKSAKERIAKEKKEYQEYVSSGQRKKDRDVYKKKGKEEIKKASDELKNRNKSKAIKKKKFVKSPLDFSQEYEQSLKDKKKKVVSTKKKKVEEKLDPMGTSGETEKQYQARLKKERTDKLTSFKPTSIKARDAKYKPTKVKTKKAKKASKADRYVAEMTKRGKMGKVRKSLKTRLAEKVDAIKEGFKKKPLDERGQRKKDISIAKKAYNERMKKKYNLKYQDGGMLKGPSHAKGGIAAKVGKQPIEMEGGEYVIKKSSAKKLGEDVLNYLNETGKVPQFMAGGYAKKMYMDGGMVEEAALEMGGKVQDNRAGFTPVYEQGGKVTVSSEAGAGDIAHTHTHSGYKAGE